MKRTVVSLINDIWPQIIIIISYMYVIIINLTAHAATTSQNSLCKATQFSCSLSGPCIPLADLCNGVGDCPNGQDEARCSE